MILVTMPLHSAQAHPLAVRAMYRASEGGVGQQVLEMITQSSLLPYTFNQAWAEAANRPEVQYFAMIHGDVVPDPGWLDILYSELLKTGADLVSVVVPLKNSSGLTSTGIDVGDPWYPQRLSLTEVFDKEETFFEPKLLVNTGLFICKAKAHWNTDELCFQQHDRIIKKRGLRVAETISEDWDFSRKIRNKGALIMATRKVKCYHSQVYYHNHAPWGECKSDPTFASDNLPVEV